MFFILTKVSWFEALGHAAVGVLILLCGLSASTAGTIAANGLGPIPIVTGIEMLRDPDANLDIERVVGLAEGPGNPFVPLSGSFSQGFTRDTFWLRFTLARIATENDHWWLVVEPTFIDDLRFYAPNGQGSFVQQRAGDHVPLRERSMATRESIFTLTLTEAPQTFYLRVQSTSTLTLAMALWQPSGWASGAVLRNGLHGIFFGVMLASVLISLICALWLRQWFFVVATTYLLSFGMQHFALNGYDQLFLYPQTPALSDLTIGFVATLVPALFLFFVLLYLQPQRQCPRLSQFAGGAAWVSMFASATSLLGSYTYTAPFTPAYVGVLLILIIVLLFHMRHHQPRKVRMLMLLFLPGGIAIIPQMLRNLGLLPANFLTSYLWSLSVFLQMPFAVLVVLQRVREEELKHRDANRQATAQRNLLDMVAHELRTPLAVVETTLANIEVRTEAALPELKPRFNRITLALARLNSLVDNALAQTRLDTGQFAISPSFLAPSAFFQQVLELAGGDAAHPIALSLPTDDSPVLIDSHWLGLAVLNLLDNAAKYSQPGSAVALSTERSSGKFSIRVQDHGIGVAPDDLTRLGERFFRTDAAKALAGVKGMGLGLFLVREVAARHGGSLVIESIPGQGSTFTLEISV